MLFLLIAVSGVQHLRGHGVPWLSPGGDQPGQDRAGGREPARHRGLGEVHPQETLP